MPAGAHAGGPGSGGTPAVRVRRAGPDDLAALRELEEHFAGDRFGPRQLRHLTTRANAAVWLAWDPSGRPLGDAIVLFRHDDADARLYSLVVRPDARGRGVATALLDEAEADAEARGAEGVRLEVREDNGAALRLYARRGYVTIGRRERYYHDGATALRMRRRLRPGGEPPGQRSPDADAD